MMKPIELLPGDDMRRSRHIETAAGQAAVLFVAAGSLGFVNQLLPREGGGDGVGQEINIAAVVLGLVMGALPWQRWHPRATVALAPLAFGLIVVGQWRDPTGAGPLYAMWFGVVFAWVGSWHPPRTSLVVAPLAWIMYVVPFLPDSPSASPDAIASVAIAIPFCILLAEVIAAKSQAATQARSELEDAAQLLEKASVTDDLTGLGNRRRANVLLDSMVPGDALALLDLDHFKAVNDTRGHAEGDRVLMELGSYLLDSVRDADCVARFGGEEFLILLRGAGDGAGTIVERLVAGWRRVGCGVTLSGGVAVHVEGCGPSTTLKRADRMLYQAKADGRDRTVTELRIDPDAISA